MIKMKQIEFTQEQYICLSCKKKFYINKDDKPEGNIWCCPFCGLAETKNIRKFIVLIKSVEDHKE